MTSLISSKSTSACLRPFTRVRMSSAAAPRPRSVSQRGLSGTKNSATKKASEGTTAETNIQRQLAGPPKESSQFTRYASRMPVTMAIWLSETRRPRIAAGDTSAM